MFNTFQIKDGVQDVPKVPENSHGAFRDIQDCVILLFSGNSENW